MQNTIFKHERKNTPTRVETDEERRARKERERTEKRVETDEERRARKERERTEKRVETDEERRARKERERTEKRVETDEERRARKERERTEKRVETDEERRARKERERTEKRVETDEERRARKERERTEKRVETDEERRARKERERTEKRVETDEERRARKERERTEKRVETDEERRARKERERTEKRVETDEERRARKERERTEKHPYAVVEQESRAGDGGLSAPKPRGKVESASNMDDHRKSKSNHDAATAQLLAAIEAENKAVRIRSSQQLEQGGKSSAHQDSSNTHLKEASRSSNSSDNSNNTRNKDANNSSTVASTPLTLKGAAAAIDPVNERGNASSSSQHSHSRLQLQDMRRQGYRVQYERDLARATALRRLVDFDDVFVELVDLAPQTAYEMFLRGMYGTSEQSPRQQPKSTQVPEWDSRVPAMVQTEGVASRHRIVQVPDDVGLYPERWASPSADCAAIVDGAPMSVPVHAESSNSNANDTAYTNTTPAALSARTEKAVGDSGSASLARCWRGVTSVDPTQLSQFLTRLFPMVSAMLEENASRTPVSQNGASAETGGAVGSSLNATGSLPFASSQRSFVAAAITGRRAVREVVVAYSRSSGGGGSHNSGGGGGSAATGLLVLYGPDEFNYSGSKESSAPVEETSERLACYPAMILVWSLYDTTTPDRVLVSYASLQCVCSSVTCSYLVYAGAEDGTLAVWDTREPERYHAAYRYTHPRRRAEDSPEPKTPHAHEKPHRVIVARLPSCIAYCPSFVQASCLGDGTGANTNTTTAIASAHRAGGMTGGGVKALRVCRRGGGTESGFAAEVAGGGLVEQEQLICLDEAGGVYLWGVFVRDAWMNSSNRSHAGSGGYAVMVDDCWGRHPWSVVQMLSWGRIPSTPPPLRGEGGVGCHRTRRNGKASFSDDDVYTQEDEDSSMTTLNSPSSADEKDHAVPDSRVHQRDDGETGHAAWERNGWGRRCAYDLDCRAEDASHLLLALSDGLHHVSRSDGRVVAMPSLYTPLRESADDMHSNRDGMKQDKSNRLKVHNQDAVEKRENEKMSEVVGGGRGSGDDESPPSFSMHTAPQSRLYDSLNLQVAARCVRYGAMDHRTLIAGYEDGVVRVYTRARATPELTVYLTPPPSAQSSARNEEDLGVVAVRCSAAVRWLTFALDGSGVMYILDLAHKQREVPLFAQALGTAMGVGGRCVCMDVPNEKTMMGSSELLAVGFDNGVVQVHVLDYTKLLPPAAERDDEWL